MVFTDSLLMNRCRALTVELPLELLVLVVVFIVRAKSLVLHRDLGENG